MLFLQRNYNEALPYAMSRYFIKLPFTVVHFVFISLLQLKHLFDVRNASVSGEITALRILTLTV